MWYAGTVRTFCISLQNSLSDVIMMIRLPLVNVTNAMLQAHNSVQEVISWLEERSVAGRTGGGTAYMPQAESNSSLSMFG